MENLNENCFAYPSMRKYPIHTKEAALKAYEEFQSDKLHYGPATRDGIMANFEKAAAYHEIDLSSMEKQASFAEPEQLLFDNDDEKIIMTKIAHVDDVQAATKWILEKRASANWKDLQEPAKYVLWCASNSDLDLSTTEMQKLAKIAGIGVGSRENIEKEFEKRAAYNRFDGNDHDAFWQFSRELKALSDEEFYKEATLNKICNAMDRIDGLYDNKYRYGRELQAPEDVCFADTLEDLVKQAKDLMYVESIDTTLSKTALLERSGMVNSFFKSYFGQENELSGEELITKVASLDAKTANALLESVE